MELIDLINYNDDVIQEFIYMCKTNVNDKLKDILLAQICKNDVMINTCLSLRVFGDQLMMFAFFDNLGIYHNYVYIVDRKVTNFIIPKLSIEDNIFDNEFYMYYIFKMMVSKYNNKHKEILLFDKKQYSN